MHGGGCVVVEWDGMAYNGRDGRDSSSSSSSDEDSSMTSPRVGTAPGSDIYDVQTIVVAMEPSDQEGAHESKGDCFQRNERGWERDERARPADPTRRA